MFSCKTDVSQPLPLYFSRIHAGFPSPADDFIDRPLDLNEHLIHHPAATFFVKVQGDSMVDAGIHPGALLVVDRSLQARSGNIVLAVLNGEFTVKRLQKENGNVVLYPENPRYQPVTVTSGMDFEVWGVVVHVVRTFV
ncbi:MAG: translesion error-prone DNA polymerase V autoproteolytic subunit [Candidatus Omnitrophica bacterium]|nr:translesion error-prone DNA polymerase V autoproteolytic subunit [Candidatus Omnitrophota bacterium]